MGTALSLTLASALLFLFVPVTVLVLELAASALSGRPMRTRAPSRVNRQRGVMPRVAILIPAHNEAAGIAAMLTALRPELEPSSRVLVIADNCTDDTATIARSAGVDVTVRIDAENRGKGWALDHGLRKLSEDPPDIVVVIDADCRFSSGSLTRLVEACSATDRPVQAQSLMELPANPTTRLRVARFAWLTRNQLRPIGARNLGWPSQLMGTGMALPWSAIRATPLASAHLSEDLELGIALARQGRPALFLPSAAVHSDFPSDVTAFAVQKKRWEHGHLQLIGASGFRLLCEGIRQARWDLTGLALDLMVPPLVALLSLVLLGWALAFGLWVATGSGQWVLGLATLLLGTMAAALLSAWVQVGRDLLRAGDLLRLPAYAGSRLLSHLSFLMGKRARWVRTPRDSDARRDGDG